MRKRSGGLTFADALKRSRPAAFGSMIKPVGSACNLRCNYCYYLDKELQYGAPARVMSDELLEEYTQQYIQANRVPQIEFCWHGGEPLMAGLDFFERAMRFQQKYAGSKTITNTIQTNGTLVTDDWARFFKEHGFLVGLSIDGPEAVHDAHRVDHQGRASFSRVMAGLEKLQRFGVEFNTLSAVSAASEGRGVEIYRFMKSIGSRFMQFLPVSEYVRTVEGYERAVIVNPEESGAELAPWSVSPRGYGRFLIDVFDEWVVQDVGNYYVQMFDATLAGWCGVQPGICSFCESCGDALVVEHNGDVYSCDHFVYPEHRLGNIMTDRMGTMFASGAQFNFGIKKRSALTDTCQRCRWLHLCHGECPKHRFEGRENYLCQGLQHFFKYTAPYMEYMRGCLEQGKLAAGVMPFARERMGL